MVRNLKIDKRVEQKRDKYIKKKKTSTRSHTSLGEMINRLRKPSFLESYNHGSLVGKEKDDSEGIAKSS